MRELSNMLNIHRVIVTSAHRLPSVRNGGEYFSPSAAVRSFGVELGHVYLFCSSLSENPKIYPTRHN